MISLYSVSFFYLLSCSEPDIIQSGLDKRTGKITTRHRKPDNPKTYKDRASTSKTSVNQQLLELQLNKS